jgi:hypothetical protein
MDSNIINDFDKLNFWFIANDVFISDQKTVTIDFNSPHRKWQSKNIYIHSENCESNNNCQHSCFAVKNAEEAKYLGLYIDAAWKTKNHVEHLIKKLRQLMPAIYNISKILNYKNKLAVLDALVTSQLRYGIEIYGFAPTYLLERLQKSMNKLVKILFANKNIYKSTSTLYKEFKILSVTKLRDYVIILNNYFNNEHKCKDGPKTNYLREKTLRFKIPLIKNNYGMKCKNYYIPKTFNKLPTELTSLTTFSQIKVLIKKWLIGE